MLCCAAMKHRVGTSTIYGLAICAALSSLTPVAARAQKQIDVNRPRTPFDCDLPIGKEWYGSPARCLAELCGDRNVYNEYIFDAENRRRRNPCYGQNPTTYPDGK
jgi:hypothetical protein